MSETVSLKQSLLLGSITTTIGLPVLVFLAIPFKMADISRFLSTDTGGLLFTLVLVHGGDVLLGTLYLTGYILIGASVARLFVEPIIIYKRFATLMNPARRRPNRLFAYLLTQYTSVQLIVIAIITSVMWISILSSNTITSPDKTLELIKATWIAPIFVGAAFFLWNAVSALLGVLIIQRGS